MNFCISFASISHSHSKSYSWTAAIWAPDFVTARFHFFVPATTLFTNFSDVFTRLMTILKTFTGAAPVVPRLMKSSGSTIRHGVRANSRFPVFVRGAVNARFDGKVWHLIRDAWRNFFACRKSHQSNSTGNGSSTKDKTVKQPDNISCLVSFLSLFKAFFSFPQNLHNVIWIHSITLRSQLRRCRPDNTESKVFTDSLYDVEQMSANPLVVTT